MSSRKPDLYLDDIQQACDDILNFTRSMTSANELQDDRRTFLAVVRCLEIIGEAAKTTAPTARMVSKKSRIRWQSKSQNVTV